MDEEIKNLELDEEYSDDSLLNLVSYGADLSVRELVSMFNESELVKPSLQRNYVWDRKMASRFIDSILLGLPVPSIFLAKDEDQRLLIVDGLQRIITLVDFFNETFSKTQRRFKLHNSEIINEKWRNKTFSELAPEYQRRIKTYTLHAIIFDRKGRTGDDTAMYQIFERINTGGRVLSPQEIRNCVYHGKFNDLLLELNRNEKWRYLYGTDADERMKDVEFILRFFALKSMSPSHLKIVNLNKFLNLYMGANQNLSFEDQEVFRQEFNSTVNFVYEKFGECLIQKRPSSRKRTGISLLLESIMIGSFVYLKNKCCDEFIDSETVRNRVDSLISDLEYFNASNSRTTDEANIKMRLIKCLEIVFEIYREERI